MKEEKTNRGFDLLSFTDRYEDKCSLQKSSLAFEDCIWLGINDIEPMHLVQGEGWMPFPIPEDVRINGRMHLTQEQVRKLLPYLQKFVETGEIF